LNSAGRHVMSTNAQHNRRIRSPGQHSALPPPCRRYGASPMTNDPLRFRPVRPVPPARGATPGQPPNEDARPVRAVLRYGPGNCHVEEGGVSKHRGTEEHRGVEAAQRNRARVRPKSLGFTPESASPRRINPPRKARCRTPDSHQTHSVRLRTALTGRSGRG
jgi:hypothetical protein